MNARFKIKVRPCWTIFAYVNIYLHLKNFAWKRD